jgi:hypothetical protein
VNARVALLQLSAHITNSVADKELEYATVIWGTPDHPSGGGGIYATVQIGDGWVHQKVDLFCSDPDVLARIAEEFRTAAIKLRQVQDAEAATKAALNAPNPTPITPDEAPF